MNCEISKKLEVADPDHSMLKFIPAKRILPKDKAEINSERQIILSFTITAPSALTDLNAGVTAL